MKRQKTIILFIIVASFLQSCFDLHENRTYVVGKYFIEADPGIPLKTLYLDLGDGNAIGRIVDVKRVGHTPKLIFAETYDGYYIFEIAKDNKDLNSSEIIGLPKSHEYFLRVLDSLNIKDFEFDYYLEK